MATQQVATTVNGYEYDWSSIEYKLGEARFTGSFKKIDYSSKRERGMSRGKGPKRRGTTRGKETCSASFTMYKADFEVFRAALLAQAGPNDTYRDVAFDLIVSYEEGDLVITDTIVGARINEAKNSHSNDSADPLSVDVELDVQDVLLDGDE